MRTIASLTIVFGIILSGCAFQRAETAAAAKQSMVGMSKEQILACMGPPARSASTGSTEVWSYASGGDSSTFGSATAYSTDNTTTVSGSSSTKNRYCVVNIVMSGDHVTAVNYSGRTGGLLTGGEQCAFAVENCVR